MKALKYTAVLTIFLIIYTSVSAENYSKKDLLNQDSKTTHHGISAGVSFDVGYGLMGSLTPSIGYVRKQGKKETSIFILGNYTDHIKFGYLAYEKIFHKKSSPLFWGYQFGRLTAYCLFP